MRKRYAEEPLIKSTPIRPRPLPLQATIGVYAPSGVVNMPRLTAGIAALEKQGHHVICTPDIANQWRYFAGTDNERLAGFNTLLANKSVDMMMIARGGYGWSRLLHRIDWQSVRDSGKIFVGFSDFTAFNLAALAKANLLTFAGPGVATDFGDTDNKPEVQADHQFMQAHFWPVVRGEPITAGFFADVQHNAANAIEGLLWGSNLSLLTHLVGTPYMPDIEGGILFIEEIAEQPYAIERMFMQLFHAGILQKQKALILANFTDCNPEPGRFPYSMEHVIETLQEKLPYPVLTGLPFGHVARKLTLPFGALARVTMDSAGYSLTLNIH